MKLSKVQRAFGTLISLIEDGAEFPTAHERVCEELHLSESQSIALVCLYDAHPLGRVVDQNSASARPQISVGADSAAGAVNTGGATLPAGMKVVSGDYRQRAMMSDHDYATDQSAVDVNTGGATLYMVRRVVSSTQSLYYHGTVSMTWTGDIALASRFHRFDTALAIAANYLQYETEIVAERGNKVWSVR